MKNKKPFFFVLTGLIALTMPAHSHAESLREAVETALINHPAIDAAKARTQGAAEEERAQFSNLFPEVRASATAGRIFSNSSTTRGLTVSRGEAYSWMGEGSASLTQPLFNGFETYNRIDAATARTQAAEFSLADARQALALQAGQSYLNVLRAQEALAKTRSYQDRIKDYLKRINAMVDNGAADDSEAAQAKNILSMLENSAAEMEGQVKTAYADYIESTGSMPRGELKKNGVEKSMVMTRPEDAIEYAASYHPLILSAQKAIEAEDEEISAERGILLPKLDGELSYLKRDQKEEIGGELVDGRAVVRMNWGFSTGGGQLARIRKAKAERSEAIAREAQTKRQIERDIRRAYAEYDTALKQKELNAARAKVTQELFETYERQFEASKVRLLQLMQAENQVFTTEMERINSDYRLLMAELTTLASSGRLLTALNIEDGGAVVPVVAASRAPVETGALVTPRAQTPDPVMADDIQPATALEQKIGTSPTGK